MALVLAFVFLAVPLVTASLSLAGILSIDSRVKTRITKSQYSAIGASQHAIYRLLYEPGYADGLTTDVPDSYSVTLNGSAVAVAVVKSSAGASAQQFSPAEPSGTFRTYKGVTPSTAPPATPTTFSYVITMDNLSDSAKRVTKVHDELPAGFSYVPGSTSGVTFDEPTVVGQQLTWDLGSIQVEVQSGQSVSLAFQAGASLTDGTYCNEAWVEPGGTQTSSGKTAPVLVGAAQAGLCGGAVAIVTKTVSPALVAPNTDTNYSYTISIENGGTLDLNVSNVEDRLPPGFLYVPGSTTGDLTADDPSITLWQGRQRLQWGFTPQQSIPPGETRTLAFYAGAAVGPGDYWNEVWVTFDELPDPVYTWPTALVEVMSMFRVTATDGETETYAELWLGSATHVFNDWEIAR